MTDLGHRKTAHQRPRCGIRQIFLMVVFGAESLDASGEKTKLDSKLDDQADVVKGECFECRDELGKILFPSDRTRHENPADAGGSQPFGPSQDLLPVDGDVISVIIPKLRLSHQLLDRIPDLGVIPVQQKLQELRIEGGRSPFDRRIGLCLEPTLEPPLHRRITDSQAFLSSTFPVSGFGSEAIGGIASFGG